MVCFRSSVGLGPFSHYRNCLPIQGKQLPFTGPLLSVPLRRMGCMCVRKRFPFLRKLAPAAGDMYRRCGLFDMVLESTQVH